ncbi:ribonuclease H-like protein [Mycena floridula]|nr:ribonuclease H-like protein [Mycena floridula]
MPDMRPDPEANERATTIVYTDGSALNNGKLNAEAGAGIFIAPNDLRNRGIKILEELQPSNQVGEIVAAKEAIETFPLDVPLKIINGLTKNLQRWEDEGFHTTENGALMRVTAAKLWKRKASTTFEWVKGHSGDPGNDGADEMAAQGYAKQQSDLIDMHVDATLMVAGARLNEMTQSLAYKIIRRSEIDTLEYQESLDRKSTVQNMEYAQKAAENLDGTETPSMKQIWQGTRHKDITRSICFFLWMTIHDGYKVGHHWSKIPGFEERGICDICGQTESLKHILTQCTKAGTRCLFQIVVSENERVIQEKDLAANREIRSRWTCAMSNRLAIDCLMTNKKKYSSKAISKLLVLRTWQKVLYEEDRLSEDWTGETGVLVGVG